MISWYPSCLWSVCISDTRRPGTKCIHTSAFTDCKPWLTLFLSGTPLSVMPTVKLGVPMVTPQLRLLPSTKQHLLKFPLIAATCVFSPHLSNMCVFTSLLYRPAHTWRHQHKRPRPYCTVAIHYWITGELPHQCINTFVDRKFNSYLKKPIKMTRCTTR